MLLPEIVDHILSFLQWDHATLKVCAQAHPSLSKLVERHSYAHLGVQIQPPTLTPYFPSDLCKLILDKPNIAKHVRSLRIDLTFIGLLQNHTFIGNCHELALALPALTQLRAILLSSRTNIPWDRLPVLLRTAFTNCLRLPTLTDVEVHHVHAFPLSTLNQSGSLKRLMLSGDFSHPPLASSILRSSLDSLVLYDCYSMQTVTCWAQAYSLRALNFNGDLRLLSPLLEVCGNTLTNLGLYVPHEFHARHYLTSSSPPLFTPIPLSIACMPHLERLAIQSSISFTHLSWVDTSNNPELRLSHSCLPAIMHLLGTLPSPTKLALLLISVEIDLDDAHGGISEVNWSPLLSFPYFDVIPVELRVCAHKRRTSVRSAELLDSLKQDPHLMQLERHPSFLVTAAETPVVSHLDDVFIDMSVC